MRCCCSNSSIRNKRSGAYGNISPYWPKSSGLGNAPDNDRPTDSDLNSFTSPVGMYDFRVLSRPFTLFFDYSRVRRSVRRRIAILHSGNLPSVSASHNAARPGTPATERKRVQDQMPNRKQPFRGQHPRETLSFGEELIAFLHVGSSCSPPKQRRIVPAGCQYEAQSMKEMLPQHTI